MSAAEAIVAASAVALLALCGGVRSNESTMTAALWTSNETVTGNSSVISTTVAFATNSSNTTASPTDHGTVIALAVTIPVLVVLAVVAVVLYLLVFRKRCQRQQGNDGDTTEKITGKAVNLKGIKIRYSRNPSRKLEPPQSVTGDYATVPGRVDEEPVYENFSGTSKTPLSAQQSLNYENVPPEITAVALKAKKPKKPAAAHFDGAGRAEDPGSVADEALPNYRAPPPPASGQASAEASTPIGPGGARDRATFATTSTSGDNGQSGYVVFKSRTEQAPKKTISSPPAPSGGSSEDPIYSNTEQQQQPTAALGGRPPKVKPSFVAAPAAARDTEAASDSKEDTYYVPDKEEEEKHAPTVSAVKKPASSAAEKPASSLAKKPASSAAKKPASSAPKKPATQTALKPPTSAGSKSVGAAASSLQPSTNDDDTYIAPETEDDMYVAPEEDELYVN